MPELVTVCRTCGREHTPEHADYVRGTWRVCRACRDAATPKKDAPTEPDQEPARQSTGSADGGAGIDATPVLSSESWLRRAFDQALGRRGGIE